MLSATCTNGLCDPDCPLWRKIDYSTKTICFSIYIYKFYIFNVTFIVQEGNFVLAFSPLVHGENVLSIHTVKAPEVKVRDITDISV